MIMIFISLDFFQKEENTDFSFKILTKTKYIETIHFLNIIVNYIIRINKIYFKRIDLKKKFFQTLV
jgi:hypothetical protein